MRKCRADEVSVLVVVLASQCAKGVQLNWVHYLCNEFHANYREAQELRNMFHYVWLLMSIVLIEWELLEDIQFPSIVPDLKKAMKYASMWVTKDMKCIKDSKIFWILLEMNIFVAINHKPWFSTVFSNLHIYAEFKEDFHHVSIRAQKDPAQTWYALPYLATDDTIDAVLDHWSAKSHTTAKLAMRGKKFVVERKKEEAKLKMTQLAKKRKKEVADKA